MRKYPLPAASARFTGFPSWSSAVIAGTGSPILSFPLDCRFETAHAPTTRPARQRRKASFNFIANVSPPEAFFQTFSPWAQLRRGSILAPDFLRNSPDDNLQLGKRPEAEQFQ